MKILKSSNDSPLSLLLKKHQGLLILEGNLAHIDCIYIESINDNFGLLKKFKNIKNYKFVGDQEILERVNATKLFNQSSLKNKLITDRPIEIYYYPSNGKVLLPKVYVENIRKKKKKQVRPLLNKKKKVLVIDDSRTIQVLLKKIISSSKKLEVYAVADCPSEARKVIERERPDLITLDIHMPEMNGVEFLKTYLKELNIPVVMISSVSINEGPLVLDALSNGAITYIEKPSLDKLLTLAPEILSNLEEVASIGKTKSTDKIELTSDKFTNLYGVIAIGSSTGGTQALEAIFTSFPAEIPPIIVTQHIPAVFSKALADRLNDLCPFLVKEAENNEKLKKNTIYIAPGDKQFKLIRRDMTFVLEVNDDPPVNRFKPSVDYLFDSVAKLNIKNSLGLILTGMGNDGAKGLLKMKEAGSYTIAQDEESSVVFGMPKEAIKIGAADQVSPLNQIAENIITAYNRKYSKAS